MEEQEIGKIVWKKIIRKPEAEKQKQKELYNKFKFQNEEEDSTTKRKKRLYSKGRKNYSISSIEK